MEISVSAVLLLQRHQARHTQPDIPEAQHSNHSGGRSNESYYQCSSNPNRIGSLCLWVALAVKMFGLLADLSDLALAMAVVQVYLGRAFVASGRLQDARNWGWAVFLGLLS